MVWLIATGVFLALNGWAADGLSHRTAYFVVKGMTCHDCEVKVKKNLLEQEGVVKVDASYKAGMVRVVYDRSKVADPDVFVAAIDAAGFTARPVDAKIGERRWHAADVKKKGRKHCCASKGKRGCAASGKKKGCASAGKSGKECDH